MLIKIPNNRLKWAKVDYPEIGQIYCAGDCKNLEYPFAFVRISEDMVASLNKRHFVFDKHLLEFQTDDSYYWILKNIKLNMGEYFRRNQDG